MSKLKPLKDENDLAAVPLSEPVLVELEPAAGAEPEKREPDDEGGTVDDGAERLKRELAAAEEATQREKEARERAEREAERLRTSNAEGEKQILTGALEKAQQEQAAAKEEYKRAYEAGDADAMAEAQGKIGRSAAQIVRYEDAIAEFDATAKDGTQQRTEDLDTATQIDRAPGLTTREREWLKEHEDAWIDPNRNRELQVAYTRALKAGHKRGTDSYFRFLEEFMGYAEDGDGGAAESDGARVAAPVSREARTTAGRPANPNRVTLTPAEREMARSMGLTDVEWARGKLQLEANKRADPAKFAHRQ